MLSGQRYCGRSTVQTVAAGAYFPLWFLTCLCLNLSSFVLLNTSSRSACCRLVSVPIFIALVCSTPRVALLVVDLSRLSQPSLLCVEHLDLLCSLFSCLWWLSKYSYFRWPSSCKLLSSANRISFCSYFIHSRF